MLPSSIPIPLPGGLHRPLPKFISVAQKFSTETLADIDAAIAKEFAKYSDIDLSGKSIAISVGSRGIKQIVPVVSALIRELKGAGAKPFIIPAMGSHGGGSAEGQAAVLTSYGVTEDAMGVPVKSSLDVVVLGRINLDVPVFCDKYAYEADHVVVCNRVKPHTLFVGSVESGLMKMMLIGLGKHAGATVYHRAIKDYSFGQIVRSVAREVMAECSILAGLAIVENSYCQTAAIEAVAPGEFEERENALLETARQWMPSLPFDTADILLVDEIGKNISGSGLDLNVVGRKYHFHKPADDEYPKVRMIGVRDLTPLTHGSALGIGTIEFCRRRVLDKMDVEMTRVNALTGGVFMEAMPPLDYETDRQILEIMLTQIGLTEPPDARLMWIRNTKEIAQVECSVAYLEEARGREDLEILTDPRPLAFDAAGNLSDEHMKQ